ncbi:SUKH-4 family immunity protein [Streptomyces decoyicus]|uniref:SUKH-4 family immunity protein n=1 Tax=Streptomyces decoyicus TaxID=249567 RepID=UPI00386C4883|nr:SUKH-4 family immunity protein [Streptomyces decoyicus]
MTQPSAPGHHHISSDEAVSRVVEWWNERGSAGSRCDIVSGHPADDVLEEVHRRTPRSLLLDATGRTAEEILTEALDFVGVPRAAQINTPWRHLRKYFSADTLILLKNAQRAGRTRHSARPLQVQEELAERLSHQRKVGVVVAAPPQTDPPAREFVLHLEDVADSPSELQLSDVPAQIRVLALAEPRRVPLRVWRELARAGGLHDAEEATLEAIATQSPDLVTLDADGVAFVDEGVAEVLRTATDEDLALRVNRHLVEWLREISPELCHAEGWAASGEVGRYAADGLAMHAVQAGLFEELLHDGSAIANMTQEALLDAAHCAFDGSVPGNNPAADAVHLWSYGVIPPSQPEWAAWLHLMATAREDSSLVAGIAGSGLRLPWTTAWAHMRPPGGYHPRYLKPGVVNDLYVVHWHGRPAVAVECGSPSHLHVRDIVTGELLGGPWYDDDLPEAAQQALTWAHPDAHDTSGPTTLSDFEDADRADEGPDEEFLYLALTVEDRVIVAGASGLFVVEPAEPADFPGLAPPIGPPLSGCPTVAGPTRPVHAPDPAPADLANLFDEPTVVRTSVDDLPGALTDTAARRALTDSGLPVMDTRGMALEPDFPDFLTEIAWEEDLETPPASGPFFKIGRWVGGLIVIDGPTGRVLRMPSSPDEDGLEGTLVATSLEAFLTKAAQWITGRQILDATENEIEAHLLRQAIEDALWNIDWRGSTAGAWTYPLHND